MMNLFLKIYCSITITIFVIAGLLLIAIYNDMYPVINPPPLPNLPPIWFGDPKLEKDAGAADISVKPFKIAIDGTILIDVKQRLRNDLKRLDPSLSDYPEPIVTTFEYGFNVNFLMSQIGNHWLNQYNWTNQEIAMNNIGQQYKTNIDGLDIHFIHIKPTAEELSSKTNILPLLLIHGWPGSFIEFTEIIPMLTEKDKKQNFVFEVIIPSIPGYGFSSSPKKPGFHFGHCARVFRKLMVDRLGFKDGFYMQGGDWGGFIATAMATLYPESLLGIHLNLAIASMPSTNLKTLLAAIAPKYFLDDFGMSYIHPISEQFAYLLSESGYMHIQATKPDTVGVALSTSPLGLAAYILEKFSTWTRRENKMQEDGNLLQYYSMDKLLDNVMLYWVTNSITSSMRFYKENLGDPTNKELVGINLNPIQNVPTAIATYSDEMFLQTKDMLSGKFKNIVQFTAMPNGGHFAAMEDPHRLYKDFISFVDKVESLRKQMTDKQNSEL